jgi:MFS superfamily sulfate permease-like transporter
MNNLAKNLLASVVIFLVALPLNLGIALASGVSPTVGLLSGIIAGIVVGTLAGCPLQVSGPAAGLIAVVWQIVDAHGLEMLGPVVLAAGLLQIALGASKLAPWFRAVAPSVIQGMLAGIGVLIFASQFQVMLDQKPQVSGLANLAAIPGAVWEVLTQGTGHPSAIIGVITIGAIVAWSWLPKRYHVVPGSLIGVSAAVTAAFLFQPNIQYVVFPTDGLPELTFLSWNQIGGLASPSVLGSVLALAFIATAQTLLTATAIDRMHDGERTDYNKEIMAQGAGNTLCGALGLLPISGVIVRSATNVEAGATNRVSAVMHGVWVALFLLFFSPLLGYVPLPALAAVLVYTGYRLVNIKAIRELKKFGNAGLATYGVTLATVVSVDLLTGIVVGFVISAAHLIYTVTHCTVSTWEHKDSGATVIELQGSATFFTLPKLADKLAALPPRREVHLFMSGLNHIDHACLEHIMGWEELYIQQGGDVFIEWDHLIQRFKKPLTTELGRRSIDSKELPSTRVHESYDILASRARVIEAGEHTTWGTLCDTIVENLQGSVPSQQLRLIQRELQNQFKEQNFPVVDNVALPHLMVPGLPRHELIVVRTTNTLKTLDPLCGDIEATVLLLGPKEFTEHLNILARLSNRAEERLAHDLRSATTEMSVREALLRHDQYVVLTLEEGQPSGELVGKALWELGGQLPSGCLVAHIQRNGQSFVPGGNSQLQLEDRVLILGSVEATTQLYYRYIKTSVHAAV